MKARVHFQVLTVLAATVLALAAGCGDSDTGGTGTNPTRTATPAATGVRTATPAATVAGPTPTSTPAPGATPVTVTFTANSSAGIQGFDLRITSPTSKGGFSGSADSVACTSAAPGFTKNNKGDGNLTLIAASTSNLTFPITITCTFDQLAGQTLTQGDIGVTIHEVTENGTAGNTSDLTVSVSVS